MRVDEKTIRHVADVARLTLTDEEVKMFLPQLQEVIDTFSKLEEVNTDGVKPSFQPIELKDALREDEVKTCLSKEEALSNVTQKKDGYIKGPKAV